MNKRTAIIYLLLLSINLSGCAQNVSPNVYNGAEVGIVSKVKKGVVLSRRAVDIENSSGAGGMAGVAVGAAGGSTMGSGVSSNVAGAVGGAVVGGLLGNAIDKSVNKHQGYEYIIKLNEGETISVVQTQAMQFKPHQHVLIIYGAMTRIIPDEDISEQTKHHA
jgi:outer membrane lipoprotein SlyB